MNFEVKTNAYNIQVYEPSEYLQEVDNLVYLLQFNCTRCLSKNTFMFNRHSIDNELEDKDVYQIEVTCTSCMEKIKVEFRKKIEFKIKG